METRYEEEGLKERTREIEKSIIKRFRKEIWRPFVKALNEYEMIQEGDQIAVCISGGKDSMLLAKCMQEILRHGKMEFGLKFLVMDPGYREENRKLIHENARILGIPIHVFETEIFDTVVDVEDSPCYLCARMRRGNLYANARELGCNKIALGHHYDDAVETLLMNLLFEGRLGCFQPVTYLDRTGITQIRPLLYCREADIRRTVERLRLPVGHNPPHSAPTRTTCWRWTPCWRCAACAGRASGGSWRGAIPTSNRSFSAVSSAILSTVGIWSSRSADRRFPFLSCR